MYRNIRRGLRCSPVRALAGFALCAAAAVHANDGTGPTPLTSAISAVAAPSGSADISWVLPTQNADKTALTDLAGVLICYGTSASNLSQCVVVNGESSTNYTISGLSAGTWYFVAQAFTAGGAISSLSPIVSKIIP